VKRGSPLSRLGEATVGTACAVLLLLAVVITTGCSSLDGAKLASNALDAALVDVEPDLRARCKDPFAPGRVTATDLEERMRQADELRRQRELSGCRAELNTYDDARNVHLTLHATVGAVELGECVGTSRSVSRCNVDAAVARAWRSRTAVVALAKRLRGAK
jgi:hypothetical protein